MNLNANWNYPTAVRVGAGRRSEIPQLCRDMGMNAPLIITDPGLAALPIVQELNQMLIGQGLNSVIFSDIKANPNGKNVEDGVAFYHSGNHDGVIALGGGSALDAAKAVALMVAQNRPIWDFEDVGDNWSRVNTDGLAPVIAVPTTAGTGSEVGRASVITDEDNHVKKIIFHPSMLPAHVVLDPELTVALPPFLTAATGMDALSHNLEAYCSPFYHPMAAGIAVEGIKLVQEFLPRAFEDGSDIEARTQMLVCSAAGATAFQKGLGAMHALAHPLGALYDAHHGTLNAILMPYVVKANRSEIEGRIDALARYMNLPGGNFDSFVQWILDLRTALGIPHTLADLEIDISQADKVATMATEDPSAGGNPIQFSVEQYRDIFISAVEGSL